MAAQEPHPRCQKSDLLELDEEMTGATIAEALRQMHFEQRGHRRIMIDSGVRDYLVAVISAQTGQQRN
jgi:hypothetical protein